MGKQRGELTMLHVWKMGANVSLSHEGQSVWSRRRYWAVIQECQFLVSMKKMGKLIWTKWESKGVKT